MRKNRKANRILVRTVASRLRRDEGGAAWIRTRCYINVACSPRRFHPIEVCIEPWYHFFDNQLTKHFHSQRAFVKTAFSYLELAAGFLPLAVAPRRVLRRHRHEHQAAA